MTFQFRTRTFKSGNSVAIRLPKGLDVQAGRDFVIERGAQGTFTIKPAGDPETVNRELRRMVEDMRKIGFPPEVETREPVEAPDRPGL